MFAASLLVSRLVEVDRSIWSLFLAVLTRPINSQRIGVRIECFSPMSQDHGDPSTSAISTYENGELVDSTGGKC
jgi:hypothetical protein